MLNAINIFGISVNWDANTAMFWILAIQTVMLVMFAVLLVILIVRRGKKNTAEEKPQKKATIKAVDTKPVGEPEESAPVVVAEEVTEEAPEEPAHNEETAEVAADGVAEETVEETSEEPAPVVVTEEVDEEAPEETVHKEETAEVAADGIAEETVEETAEEAAEEVVPVAEEKNGGTEYASKYNRSYLSKLIQSSDKTKSWYSLIKNELLSYNKVKSRTSWKRETFKQGKRVVAKISLRGRMLCLFLPLNVDDYAGSKYKVEEAIGMSSFEEVPCLYRIKSERRVNYACELIADVMAAIGAEKTDRVPEDYYLPYESDEALIEKVLIKIKDGDIISKEREISAQEEAPVQIAEETPEEPIPAEEDKNTPTEESVLAEVVGEAAPAEAVEEEELAEAPEEVAEEEEIVEETAVRDGLVIRARYNKSFTAKLIQSSDEVKNWYAQLKNALLSYKKTSSRISWHNDSINCGRKKLGKFAFRGKTLILYLALDPENFDNSKYKVAPAKGKRYQAVPCMYKIKNSRRAKYGVELISLLADSLGLVKTAREPQDYYLPYEETEPLISRGLIKDLTFAFTREAVEETPEEDSAPAEVVGETVPVKEVTEETSEEDFVPAEVVDETAPAEAVEEDSVPAEVVEETAPAEEVIEETPEEDSVPAEVVEETTPAEAVEEDFVPAEVVDETAPAEDVTEETSEEDFVPAEVVEETAHVEEVNEETPEDDSVPIEEAIEEAPSEESAVDTVEELDDNEIKDVESYETDSEEEDKDGVEVVGVMFRKRGRKVYWFDPDGKTWQKGEIALYKSVENPPQEVIVVDVTKRPPDKLHMPLKPLCKVEVRRRTAK